MRIHMVSEHASPLAVVGGVDAGGQNVHVADLARHLAGLGASVVVHTRRDDPSLPRRVLLAPGVVVDHVDAGPPVPIPKDALLAHMGDFARELARAWRADSPDVVHAHFWMSGLAALRAARPLGVPVAVTFHALGVVKRRHQGAADTSPRERLELEADVARAADLVVATSDDERDELLGLGVEPSRVCVVPCGVDLARFRPVGQVAPPRTHRRRVVVVSRLVERKGITDVVDAIAARDDVELVVVGGPPGALIDHDPGAQRIRARAREVGAGGRVKLLGGIPRERVPDVLRSADLVACCPWYEPFGMVAIEAMACGVPVIASRTGGLAESVRDGETGVLVPPRSPCDLERAIADVLSDDTARSRMGWAARRHARRFGWPRIAAETLAALENLTAAEAPLAVDGARGR